MRRDVAAKLMPRADGLAGGGFAGLDPAAAYHAARFLAAGRCKKFSPAELTVKFGDRGKTTVGGPDAHHQLRMCLSRGERRAANPSSVPSPLHLCESTLKRSAGRGGAKNCQSWFRSNAEDAASADGERQRRATARLREATESSCMATQKMAGRKQNPWGTKHEQVVGLHTVPFAFDSRLEPGDFAEVFGLPRGAPASED